MSSKTNKYKKITPVFTLDIFLVLMVLIPPMIPYLSFQLRGAVFTLPAFLLWFLATTSNKQIFSKFIMEIGRRKFYFFWLILFVFIVFINYLFVRSNSKSLNYTITFIIFIFIFLIDAYYSVRPLKYRFSVLFYILLAVGVQAAISIPYILTQDIYTSRLLASNQLDGQASVEAMKHGIGNNGLYSSVGVLAILGFSVIKYFNRPFQLVIGLCSITLIFSVFISTYMASILLFIIAVLILLIRFNKIIFKPNVIFILMFLGFGFFSFYRKFIEGTNLLDPITKKIDRYKIEGGDITGRDGLAEVSLNTFLDNPVWGIGVPPNGSYDLVGEHMPWIDFLANFGLIGFLPLLIFLIMLIKKNYRFFFINDQHKFFRSACLIGVVIFVLANFISPMITVPIMSYIMLLFYLSMSGYQIERY